MKRHSLTAVICTLIVVAWAAAGAEAAPKTDTFQAVLDGQNHVMSGGGTGWDFGAWIYYPNTNWNNQWFYDDPPNRLRWKHIGYDIMADQFQGGTGGPPTYIDIVINWSTMAYPSNPNMPPIPPLTPAQEAAYIDRSHLVYAGPAIGLQHWTGNFDIPDYNPEWVSIDVLTMGGYPNMEAVSVFGSITHECLPEPATLSLLALGGLALIRRRK